MRSKKRFLLLAALPIAAAASFTGGGVSPTVVHAFDPSKAPEIQDRLLDGLASFEFKTGTEVNASQPVNNYTARSDDGCGLKLGSNVKVNQNCLNLTDSDLQGRAQAQNETSIAADPMHPNHLLASYNDYRRGDANCYGSFSSDNGKSWTDTTIPMSFTRGGPYGAARQYWQAGGDTSVAYDTRGNAYFSCQVFQRGAAGMTPNPDLSSAFFVFRSTGNNGASWNFPGRPVVQSPDVTGSGAKPFLDKQLMTVDNHVGSPFQDRVYVTWTTFDANGTAYIYEAFSNDYAQSFSAPILVSSDSALCGNNFGLPTPNGQCNENQFSEPFTGKDGNLYVAWANYNNTLSSANDNHNQMLLAKSTDGGASFSAPVQVGNYNDLPDCATYQGGADPGRACVPEKAGTTLSIFRAASYPSAAVNPKNPSQIVVNYGSYINKNSNAANGCTAAGINPATGQDLYTGVKTPGSCNNKVLISVSNDAGGSFTATGADPATVSTVNTAKQAGTDQWWQWTAFNSAGKLAVSYYDRQYGTDETTGYSDFSLSGSADLSSFRTARVTSSSMPPPTQFGGVFFGDYTGLAATTDAYPLWADTRDADLFLCPGTGVVGTPPAVCTGTESGGFQAGMTANDEDIFVARVQVPTADH